MFRLTGWLKVGTVERASLCGELDRRLNSGGMARSLDDEIVASVDAAKRVALAVAKFYPSHVCRQDLVSAACEGLVEASKRYDPTVGVALIDFARPRIRGAVVDALRARDLASKGLRVKQRELLEAERVVAARVNRSPTGLEVARQLGCSVEALDKLKHKLNKVGAPASLCTEIAGLKVLTEPAAGPEDMCIAGQDRIAAVELAWELIQALPDRERSVVVSIVIHGEQRSVLAQRWGVTPSRITQLKTRGLKLMRDQLTGTCRSVTTAW